MERPDASAPVATSGWTRIPTSDPAAWRGSLADVPHGFAHGWHHCEAMERASGRPTFLLRLQTAQGPCLCPLQERTRGGWRDLVTPYGNVGFVGAVASPDLPALWRAFARDEGYVCAYVALHPALGEAGAFARDDVSRRGALYLLDLERSPGELLAAMSSSRRREVLASVPADEEAWARDELAAFFVERYPEFMASRGAADVYDVPRDVLASWVEAPETLLVGAGRGSVEAVALFGATSWLGTYLFGVWPGRGSRYGARLLWRGALELKRRGVPLLDLGGGVREGDGVAEFKRRFGADERAFHALRQVFDDDAYRRLCAEAGVDPDDRSGYFPAYRRSS